jgi:hypothetical protein
MNKSTLLLALMAMKTINFPNILWTIVSDRGKLGP